MSGVLGHANLIIAVIWQGIHENGSSLIDHPTWNILE